MFVKSLILSEHPRNCSRNDCHKYSYSSAVLFIILEAPVPFTLQFDSTTPPHPQKWNRGRSSFLTKEIPEGNPHLQGPCPVQGTFGYNIRQILHPRSEISTCLG